MCLLHFCTGSEERYLRASCIRRKKLMLVPTGAGGCRWRAQCSTSHRFQTDGKVSFSSRALLLLLPSLLSAPTEPPNYCVVENIFLPLPELLIRCLQKTTFRSLQHFPLLHSITLWRNTRAGAEWRPFSGYQHDLQSKHEPCQLPRTKLIPAAASVTSLELLKEEIWYLQLHNQMWMRMCY